MSKRLPEAACNYSITELEMCELVINIASFAHLQRKVDFDAVVDHLAITQIMRSKVEPATSRIKRLLEVLSSYSFKLYYIKGKDMILSDFLSRQKIDNSNSSEIIPISFNIRSVLQDKYYSLEGEKERYMVQTKSQMKARGVQLPEVHGSRKGLDPHKIPEKQPQPIVGLDINRKPRLGQGRAGVRRKIQALHSSYTGPGASESKPILINNEAVSAADPVLPKPMLEIPRSKVLPPYLFPQNRPLQNPLIN